MNIVLIVYTIVFDTEIMNIPFARFDCNAKAKSHKEDSVD